MKFVVEGGHGYFTPGKRSPDSSMHEWEFNNAVAVLVEKKLLEYENVQTLFVSDKTGKTDVPLQTRTDKANEWGADAYVSIHANASGDAWTNASGIETYVYVSPSAESLELAKKVHTQLIALTGRKDRGVKRANLHVCRETHMPSILVEGGFMTNKEELALLKSDAYRKKVAQAVTNGVAFQYKLKKKAVEVAKPPAPETVAGKDLYRVQVGAFNNIDNAKALANKITAAGFHAIVVKIDN